MPLPNFLVIGAEKSGTTYLKHNLLAHPDIFVPSQKELHFFNKDENFQQGIEWYRQFFSSVAGEKAIGEITPGYLPSQAAPDRIRQVLPDVKLIAVLRNPIDRAYSAYWMNISKANVIGEFNTVIKKYPHLLENGKYGSQLLRFAKHFEQDEILIIRYSEIQEPQSLFPKVFSFLGVDKVFFPPRALEKIITASVPKSITMNMVVYFVKRLIRKITTPSSARNINIAIEYMISRPGDYPPMEISIRKQLLNYYEKEFQILEREFHFLCDGWRF